jgi:hypothetical protein
VEAIQLSLDQLHGMIGVSVSYRGHAWRVVEVLEDGPSLVLEADESRDIQTDMHGRARRHVRENIEIAILSADKTRLSLEFLDLDLI